MRKTNVDGRSVTAMTCTNNVMRTSGACGIKTTHAERDEHEEKTCIEPRRLANALVQRCAQPKTSPNAHDDASEMQIAPRKPASKRPIADIPANGFVGNRSSAACAALSISTPRRNVPATMITAAATMIVKIAPSAVSSLPHGISFSCMPLSTTELCWKKTIHGAIIIPMFAMRKKNSVAVSPPGNCGMSPCTTSEICGWTMIAAGIYKMLSAAKSNAIFSHVQ